MHTHTTHSTRLPSPKYFKTQHLVTTCTSPGFTASKVPGIPTQRVLQFFLASELRKTGSRPEATAVSNPSATYSNPAQQGM